MSQLARTDEKVFRGIPVSAGIARGRIFKLSEPGESIKKQTISESDIPHHIARLEKALIQTRKQILEVQKRVSQAMGAEEASIFEAHLLVLEDQTLLEEVPRLINQEKLSVDYAFHLVVEKYIDTLSAIEDEYLRERAKDLRDVATRITNNLLGQPDKNELQSLREPCVVIAEDLSPSVTAQLDRKMVLGFGTDMGSKTSHTAILARSLQIPAVVGLQGVSQQFHTGQYVLLDGFNGLVIINPTDQTLFEYGQLLRKQVDLHEKLAEVKDQPAITLDGHAVALAANVAQITDASIALASGAEGVGLYRTEFLFINQNHLPTEEEQIEAYRHVAAALKPHTVIIRTLDLGGDKFMSHIQWPAEINPSLGWRAIRFCLHEKDLFRTQLRAILRASAEGNIKMMYPMISGLEELTQANDLLEECKSQLRSENLPFNEAMEVGVMIEIPSAVMVAGALAKRVDFFSLGTNDLIQYTLAVDRLNEKIAHLYDPTHPAILRLIKMTVDAAHQNKIWAGVCGEMAGDPIFVPLLLGLGLDELSVAPLAVPRVKYLIRRLKLTETQALAEFALNEESSADILARCDALTRAAAPALFEQKTEAAPS